MTSQLHLHRPEIPPELHEIEKAIEESRSILDLRDDWDGEGSPGYADEVLDRANEFLIENAVHLWTTCGLRVDAPVIGPGPNGSIDIHWRTRDRSLLVNIPADDDEVATFYGDDRRDPARRTVEGRLDLSAQNHWLLMWLAL